MQMHGCALVTGASRGLGRAIAIELAHRGFDVVAGVRNVSVAETDLQEATRTAPGSMRVEHLDMRALGDYVPPEGLRVLVNNAGFRGRYLPVEHSDLDEWRKTFETNLFGVVELTRRAIPSLRAASGGVICNIGSLGVYAPMPFYSMYRASKAALAALSEGLCVELAPLGIRVIDIPIGGVDTDMLRSGIAHRPPEAVQFDAYRPMAERQMELTRRLRTETPSPAQVACKVVDEILSADGPLRRACDPVAADALAHGASAPEEQRLQAMMARLAG